jgi:hypothetical protein
MLSHGGMRRVWVDSDRAVVRAHAVVPAAGATGHISRSGFDVLHLRRT